MSDPVKVGLPEDWEYPHDLDDFTRPDFETIREVVMVEKERFAQLTAAAKRVEELHDEISYRVKIYCEMDKEIQSLTSQLAALKAVAEEKLTSAISYMESGISDLEHLDGGMLRFCFDDLCELSRQIATTNGEGER